MKYVIHDGIVYELQPKKSAFIMVKKGKTKQPDTFTIGETVTFMRQAVNYETKELTGKIVSFGWSGLIRTGFPVAHIKAKAEYGNALEYNHTVPLISLTKTK